MKYYCILPHSSSCYSNRCLCLCVHSRLQTRLAAHTKSVRTCCNLYKLTITFSRDNNTMSLKRGNVHKCIFRVNRLCDISQIDSTFDACVRTCKNTDEMCELNREWVGRKSTINNNETASISHKWLDARRAQNTRERERMASKHLI